MLAVGESSGVDGSDNGWGGCRFFTYGEEDCLVRILEGQYIELPLQEVRIIRNSFHFNCATDRSAFGDADKPLAAFSSDVVATGATLEAGASAGGRMTASMT